MPLGLFPEADYEVQRITLNATDLLVCYTDGVTEAMDPEEEMFGEERLREVVEACASVDVADVIETVRQAVSEHTRDEPQYDDLTLLVLKLRARSAGTLDPEPGTTTAGSVSS